MSGFGAIEIDDRPFRRFIKGADKKQIPFVMAQTLTGVAFSGQDRMRERMGQVFTIRKKGLVKQVRVEKANKRDGAKMSSAVFIPKKSGGGKLLPRFDKHESGGTVRPRKRLIAVPTDKTKRTKTGGIGKANRPTALLNKKGHFLRKGGKGSVGLYRRRGGTVTKLYTMVRKARLQPVLGWQRTVEDNTRRELPKRWERNWKKALQSARR